MTFLLDELDKRIEEQELRQVLTDVKKLGPVDCPRIFAKLLEDLRKSYKPFVWEKIRKAAYKGLQDNASTIHQMDAVRHLLTFISCILTFSER